MIGAREGLLALSLWLATPGLSIEQATEHARHAIAVETEPLPAELLLGVARVESYYDPRTVSRVSWARAWGFCGVLQTIAWSARECRAQRDLVVGYALGARELEQWRRDPRVRGDVRRMLRGHACGYAGLRMRCPSDRSRVPYDVRVIRAAKKLGWRP